MFLFGCQSQTTSGGGGGSTTIISNYFLNSPINTTNFARYPVVSPHLKVSGSPTYVNNHLSGTFTLTMKELSVFNSMSFSNRSGGTAVFYNGASSVMKTITADTMNDQILFTSVVFTLGTTELSRFTWQAIPGYTTMDFTVAGPLLEFYPIMWQNATSNGTTLSSTVAGNIVAQGYTPFIIYSMEFTGTVYLYDEVGALIYSDTVLNYPNPIWRMELDGTATSISYITYYSVPQEYTTFTAQETYMYNYVEGVFTFNKPTFIRNIVMNAPGVLSVNGIQYTTGSFDKIILAQSLSGNIATVDCARELHFEQVVGDFINLDFTAFAQGEINIENDYFLITSNDQLNTPAMINNGVIWSTNGDCLTPTGGSGLINVRFKQPTYVSQILFEAGTSGSISIVGKTYFISSTTVDCRDFVNSNCALCDSLTIDLSGKLTGFVIFTTLPEYYERDSQYYVVEDFASKSVEFPSTTFTTNVASALGTPNTSYSGPGIGAGGGPGNGQNDTFLGNATQSNVVFDTERWVKSIKLINCMSGYKLDFLNASAVNISSVYVGNFGQNSVHTLNVNKKAKTINITGNLAIAEIIYGAVNRVVVGLPDNAITPANIGTALYGNFVIKIVGDASAIITASNASASTNGTVNMQTSVSPTGESIYAQWPAGSPLQIYHHTFKTGGTGATLWYVCYF